MGVREKFVIVSKVYEINKSESFLSVLCLFCQKQLNWWWSGNGIGTWMEEINRWTVIRIINKWYRKDQKLKTEIAEQKKMLISLQNTSRRLMHITSEWRRSNKHKYTCLEEEEEEKQKQSSIFYIYLSIRLPGRTINIVVVGSSIRLLCHLNKNICIKSHLAQFIRYSQIALCKFVSLKWVLTATYIPLPSPTRVSVWFIGHATLCVFAGIRNSFGRILKWSPKFMGLACACAFADDDYL